MTNSRVTTMLTEVPPAIPDGAEVMTVTVDRLSRFLAVMMCVPGEPMLTLVSADELRARRHLRHGGA